MARVKKPKVDKSGRTSAGILLWRRREGRLEVLLGHPGGPYFAGKDAVVVFEPKRYEAERELVARVFASLEAPVELRVPRFGGKDDVFLLVFARSYRP